MARRKSYEVISEIQGLEAQIARLQSFDCDTDYLSERVDSLYVELRKLEAEEDQT